MTKPQAHQIMTIKNQSKDKPNPCTKQAAHERQQTLNEQIDAFFKAGGKITKLPDYDDTHEENRPRACGFGGGSLI